MTQTPVPQPGPGSTPRDDAAAHVQKLIMSTCTGVDGLRVLSVMLASASNRPMTPLDRIYYDHLAAIVTDLRDLHRLFDGLNRKLLSSGLETPDHMSV